jgi:hypothetical protein
MDQEINQMIERIIPQLQKLWLPILIFSVLMGLSLIIIGLCRQAAAGNRMGSQRSALSVNMVLVLIGFVLTNIPAALDTVALSTLQQPSIQELSYMPPEGIGRLYIQLAVYIIQLVGLCAFARGWSLMRDFGSRRVLGRSAAHIIGGAWAVNIIGFWAMAGKSFGGPIQEAVQFTLG